MTAGGFFFPPSDRVGVRLVPRTPVPSRTPGFCWAPADPGPLSLRGLRQAPGPWAAPPPGRQALSLVMW